MSGGGFWILCVLLWFSKGDMGLKAVFGVLSFCKGGYSEMFEFIL